MHQCTPCDLDQIVLSLSFIFTGQDAGYESNSSLTRGFQFNWYQLTIYDLTFEASRRLLQIVANVIDR